jgi:hypothetical protein
MVDLDIEDPYEEEKMRLITGDIIAPSSGEPTKIDIAYGYKISVIQKWL